MYGNEKNPSKVFEIYERLFELKQKYKSVPIFYGEFKSLIDVPKFYREFKSLIDELYMHQPVVTDTVTLRGYRQDLAVSKFLSGLSPTLRSQARGQKLEGDSIPTLTATFSRVILVSTGVDISSA